MRSYDFRGKECPEGYVLVTRVIDNLPPGEEAEVLMDSWRCAAMVVYALKDSRLVRFNVEREGNVFRFVFSRA